MTGPSQRSSNGAAGGEGRFDGETVRLILQRAAEEQHRLNTALADSYSTQELEEMAAEAGISREALRAAIESHAAQRALDAVAAHPSRNGLAPDAVSAAPVRRWLAALESRMPGRSPAARRILLTSTAAVAVVGLLLAFPSAAATLFWGALLALIVLLVLGVSPF